jgi:hypothetical protein
MVDGPGRVAQVAEPAKQLWGPEFKPQYQQEPKKNMVDICLVSSVIGIHNIQW